MKTARASFLLCAAAMTLAACGGGSSSRSSAPPDLSAFLGTYSGTWHELGNSGTMTMIVATNRSGYPSISGVITNSASGASGTYSDKNCGVTRNGDTVIFLDFRFDDTLKSSVAASGGRLAWKGYLLSEAPGVLANEVNVDPTGGGSPSSIVDTSNSSSPVFVSLSRQ